MAPLHVTILNERRSGLSQFELLVWPHEVEPYGTEVGRIETLNAKYIIILGTEPPPLPLLLTASNLTRSTNKFVVICVATLTS